ncbi:MAG: hypothetical protein MPW15_13910 [Candidatus Manganitrophus sp.]|nr:hypothetical protein [Candidatus Manganitrophus sp.]
MTVGDGQNTIRWGTVPGAGTFDIYRDVVAGVDVTDPLNLIEDGITGTSFTDTNNISNGTTYYYVVTQNGNPTTPSPEVSATPARMTALYVGTGGGGVFSSGPAGEFRKASNTGLGTGDGLGSLRPVDRPDRVAHQPSDPLCGNAGRGVSQRRRRRSLGFK